MLTLLGVIENMKMTLNKLGVLQARSLMEKQQSLSLNWTPRHESSSVNRA